MPNPSKLKQFYEKKSVFITGASGFIGKVCLEITHKSYNNSYRMTHIPVAYAIDPTTEATGVVSGHRAHLRTNAA